MKKLENQLKRYLDYCQFQKELDEKTLKAYKTDIHQFMRFVVNGESPINKELVNGYLVYIHKEYKQKSVKRKIASIKAFFNYLEQEGLIESSPFNTIKTKFKEEFILPKTIPENNIEDLLKYMYHIYNSQEVTLWKRRMALRDIAVIELLFATGLRISELCNLKNKLFDLESGILCIRGKGGKERYLQVVNPDVIFILKKYKDNFKDSIEETGYFFINRFNQRYSEQSARRMIKKYTCAATIDMHITPHMFRHAFATLLLEEDVDIRYIQKMLGHSSIITTQIYTYVTSEKQKQILKSKHPRNNMIVNKC